MTTTEIAHSLMQNLMDGKCIYPFNFSLDANAFNEVCEMMEEREWVSIERDENGSIIQVRATNIGLLDYYVEQYNNCEKIYADGSFLPYISSSGGSYPYKWANNKFGTFHIDNYHVEVRFHEYDAVFRSIDLVKRLDYTQIPVVASGIIGYYLMRLREKIYTKTLFLDYIDLNVDKYFNLHKTEPDACKRNLINEFYAGSFLEEEKERIKQSEAIMPFVSESEAETLRQIASNFIEYYLQFVPNEIKVKYQSDNGQPQGPKTELQSKPITTKDVEGYLNKAVEAKLITMKDDGTYALCKGTSQRLIAYLCGRIYCGDFKDESGCWGDGGEFNHGLHCSKLFGFDVGATRRSARNTGKLPRGYQKVDKLFD